MSRYFDALNRLKKARNEAAAPDLGLAKETRPVAFELPEEPVRDQDLPFPQLPLSSHQASYATLLDLLRAKCKASTIPAVVVAGVSGGEPVHEVVGGIAHQAGRLGVTLRRGFLRIASGARVLQLEARAEAPEIASHEAQESGSSLRLPGSPGTEAFAGCLEQAAAGSDLLVVEAPPLSSSVEAALVGAAGEGLVVVAETLVTNRSALREGIERAQLAECEVLGIVLTGTKQWLPGWIGRLFGLFGSS